MTLRKCPIFIFSTLREKKILKKILGESTASKAIYTFTRKFSQSRQDPRLLGYFSLNFENGPGRTRNFNLLPGYIIQWKIFSELFLFLAINHILPQFSFGIKLILTIKHFSTIFLRPNYFSNYSSNPHTFPYFSLHLLIKIENP